MVWSGEGGLPLGAIPVSKLGPGAVSCLAFDVRFTPESGHTAGCTKCPLSAKSRHYAERVNPQYTGKNTAAISVGSSHFSEQFAPLASGLYISENGQGALKRFFVSATNTWVSWSVLAAAL
jgi:hypothetical protein